MLVLGSDELFLGCDLALDQPLDSIQLSLRGSEFILRLDQIHLKLLDLRALNFRSSLTFMDRITHVDEESCYFSRNAAADLSFSIGMWLNDPCDSKDVFNWAQIGNDCLPPDVA